MNYLILRNLKIYFRDKMAVFFSMLSVLITLLLYTVFLADSLLVDGALSGIEGNVTLLYTWLLAGILGIVSVTTTLASYGIMVQDKINGAMKDFYSSPIKRYKLVMSYIISACMIGIFMSLFTLIVGETIIVLQGGPFIRIAVLIKTLGLIILTVTLGSSMMFLLASFLKTDNSFTNASTLVGTLIGFIMGIYLPVGMLPEFAQSILKSFPLSHGCALFRQILMEDALKESLLNAPVEITDMVNEVMGITLSINNTIVTPTMTITILLVTTFIFFLLSTISMKRKHQ